MVWSVAAGAVLVLSTWLAANLATTKFLPNGCQRLEDNLNDNIVGQELAIQQLVSAVCAHLDKTDHQKPLVISVHGPPGVGKSFTHMLMAKALYNKHPDTVTNCPGAGCAGYKVLYGLDFPAATRLEQLQATKEALLSHTRSVTDPLIVFEEYDKMDCTARTWLRNLLDHAYDADNSGALSRAIILLESNLGYTQLEEMLTDVEGKTDKLTFEGSEQVLREALFSAWFRPAAAAASSQLPGSSQPVTEGAVMAGGQEGSGCEDSYVDTLRFTSLVDFFLPYLPLQKQHVQQVVHKALQRMATRLLDQKHVQMQWDDAVDELLASKVDFDGPYPLEGAKQVASVVTRYIVPALRKCPALPASSWLPGSQKQAGQSQHVMKLAVLQGQLTVQYPQTKSS